MAESIKCPSCRAEIPLSEVISHQIEEELAAKLALEVAAKEEQFAQQLAAREAELRKRAEEKVATALADLGASWRCFATSAGSTRRRSSSHSSSRAGSTRSGRRSRPRSAGPRPRSTSSSCGRRTSRSSR
jgi:hypothetical protein